MGSIKSLLRVKHYIQIFIPMMLILGIFTLGHVHSLNHTQWLLQNETALSPSSVYIPPLMSNNVTFLSEKVSHTQFLNENPEPLKLNSSVNNPPPHLNDSSRFFPDNPIANLKIMANYDLLFEKISPEAIEKNATQINYILNFTVTNTNGTLNNPEDHIQNLTITNSSHTLFITTWENWTSLYGDHYSLAFIINNSIISSLDLGNYDLNFWIRVFDGTFQYSNFSISFPMKDLRVQFLSPIPSRFNNKLDTDQFFNFTIKVAEHDGTGLKDIDFLPALLGSNGKNTNPKITIQSSTNPDISGLLHFVYFVDNSSASLGEFTFMVNMTGSVALRFNEAFHSLILQITSAEGITANASIHTFEAKGTVFIVEISNIQVNDNPLLNFDDLTNSSQQHIGFRLNLNDNISLWYQVLENDTTRIPSEQIHLMTYRDPNRAIDPTAFNYSTSSSTGNGVLTLSANSLTPGEGYILLLYVSGHKSSQQISEPTNITIYWDQLKYKYRYFDNLDIVGGYGGDYGSIYQQKTLGVDINETWSVELEIFYASDNSPALTSQISYRFSDDWQWTNLTDGMEADQADGSFLINKVSTTAQTLTFTCRILNGSIIDPSGTKFVNTVFNSVTFDLNITWTFIIINLVPTELDARVNLGEITSLDVQSYWAHDPTNQTLFTGIIKVKDDQTNSIIDVVLTNGIGNLAGLFKTDIGRYTFSVILIDDSLFEVTKFGNTTIYNPDDSSVQVGITWDGIFFTFTDYYNYSLPISAQNWGVASFFTNYGENVSLYCYGRHASDQKPFTGYARLYDFNIGAFTSIYFPENGTAIFQGDRTDARRAVPFQFLVIESENHYNITQIATRDSNYVEITWEKIILTMAAKQEYSHGTWADVDVYYEYEISGHKVNPFDIRYDVLFSNESTLREDFSLTSFRVFSFGTSILTFSVEFFSDYSTCLTVIDVWYNWTDSNEGSLPGNLVITWIDDIAPIILETQAIDLGNGTILILIIATDNSEKYEGSGLQEITLWYKSLRFDTAWAFPQHPEKTNLLGNRTLYTFRYSYNQLIDTIEFPQWIGSREFFQFNFSDPLSFDITIIDKAGYSTTRAVDHIADFDPNAPIFLKLDNSYINVNYETMNSTTDIIILQDGSVIVNVLVKDNNWSGLNESSVKITITDLESQHSEIYIMDLVNVTLADYDPRSTLLFQWKGILTVFMTYSITVTVWDNAGNSESKTIEIDIQDVVAPQIKEIFVKETSDRTISITVVLVEAGIGIDYVTVEILIHDQYQMINLTYQGGSGAQADRSSSNQTYSAIVTPIFELGDIFTPTSYSIQIITFDKSGNKGYYDSATVGRFLEDNPKTTLTPLVLNPLILLSLFLALIIGIVIGIRVTSRVEGYDLKKIHAESEKITRETILTQMDEYVLGVTVNFFDQVQGPVPVIYEPPLLEDQEQVMLDLSDKSFSILEFVGIDEYERSGTFDFSTGSYECTALGYSFGVDNPQARGGKENLTVVLLLRKEWGDNLLIFQDELVEKLREIRKLVESKTPTTSIEKKARELREYVSRLMITLDRLYLGGSLEQELTEE